MVRWQTGLTDHSREDNHLKSTSKDGSAEAMWVHDWAVPLLPILSPLCWVAAGWVAMLAVIKADIGGNMAEVLE